MTHIEDTDNDISDNVRETSAVDSRPLSVEEMAKRFNIDLTVWEKERILSNVWQMGAKDEQRELKWEEGVISGEVSTGGIVVTNLYQTKIWWIRIEPVALAPVLYPVDVTGFSFSHSAKIRAKTKPSILVIPDLHAGYVRKDGKEYPMHDKQAMDIIRQLAKNYFFDDIIFLGDTLDFAEWTDHFPTPNEQRDTTQRTLVEVSAFIAEIRANNPRAKIIYFEGNHEKRMRSLLVKLVPAAYGLKSVRDLDGFPAMSIPGLLGLKELGIEWIGNYPSGEHWIDDTLRFVHGDIARKSGLTAAHYVNSFEYSTVFGHVHRREYASRTIWKAGKPSTVFAVSPGCLCRIEDNNIVPASKDRNNWQQGALVLTKYADRWIPEQIEIENGIGYFRGEIITK